MAGKLAKTTSFDVEIDDKEAEKRANNSQVMKQVMQYYNIEPVYTDEAVKKRSAEYFQRCIDSGIKPTWEEYVLCLGVTMRTINNWLNGESSRVSPNTIIRAKEIIASFDARMVVDGKINPVTYFFRAKNYYGMKDQNEVILTPNTEKVPDPEALVSEANSLPCD